MYFLISLLLHDCFSSQTILTFNYFYIAHDQNRKMWHFCVYVSWKKSKGAKNRWRKKFTVFELLKNKLMDCKYGVQKLPISIYFVSTYFAVHFCSLIFIRRLILFTMLPYGQKKLSYKNQTTERTNCLFVMCFFVM